MSAGIFAEFVFQHAQIRFKSGFVIHVATFLELTKKTRHFCCLDQTWNHAESRCSFYSNATFRPHQEENVSLLLSTFACKRILSHSSKHCGRRRSEEMSPSSVGMSWRLRSELLVGIVKWCVISFSFFLSHVFLQTYLTKCCSSCSECSSCT